MYKFRKNKLILLFDDFEQLCIMTISDPQSSKLGHALLLIYKTLDAILPTIQLRNVDPTSKSLQKMYLLTELVQATSL